MDCFCHFTECYFPGKFDQIRNEKTLNNNNSNTTITATATTTTTTITISISKDFAKMVLGQLNENQPQIRQTPVKQRVISESTGLVKFNTKSSSNPKKDDFPTTPNNDSSKSINLEKKFSGEQYLSASSPLMNHTASNAAAARSSISPKRSMIQLLPTNPESSSSSSSSRPKPMPNNAYSSSSSSNIPRRSRGNSQASMNSNNSGNNAPTDPFASNQDIYLRLASKQRHVLELKFQMQNLQEQLKEAELELKEIEKLCGERSNIPTNNNNNNNSNSSNNNNHSTIGGNLRGRQSISNLLSSVSLNPASNTYSSLYPTPEEEPSQQFTNNNTNQGPFTFQSLKKRISISQFPTQANFNFNKLQQDTESLIGKGLEFMNTIKDEVFRELDEEDEEDKDGDKGGYTERDATAGTGKSGLQNGIERMKSLRFRRNDEPLIHNDRVKYSKEADYDSDEEELLDEGESSLLSEYGGADVSDFTLAVK